MTISPAQAPSKTYGPVLIGVLIDVSNSMQRSWRNTDGKNLPRIEVVRDALNKRIREEQRRITQDQSVNEIELFCLGMGFKAPVYSIGVNLSNEREHSLGDTAKKGIVVDLTCDLLALSEILPGKERLTDFKKKLNKKWIEYTQDILDQSVINEDLYAELVEHVQQALYETAIQHFHRGMLYTSFHRFKVLLQRNAGLYHYVQSLIANKEENIDTVSKIESAEYVQNLFTDTRQIFTTNAYAYAVLINKQLNAFAHAYIDQVLRALTLGFETIEMVEDLDKEKVIAIAKQIYALLEAEVKKHMRFVFIKCRHRLFRAKRGIGASFDNKKLQTLTERFIEKSGWDILKPFIEQTVTAMFATQFEKEAKESFPYWIRLATTREVVRSLKQLSNILPDTVEGHVYSNEVMFGSTPFKEALDKAAIRLIDKKYTNHEKLLLIISDGDFAEENEFMVSVNLLKRRGVTIVSCLISEKNILSHLVKKSVKAWPMGARLMTEIASKASEAQSAKLLSTVEQSQHKLTEEKLCFQINHSNILEDVIEGVFEGYSKTEA